MIPSQDIDEMSSLSEASPISVFNLEEIDAVGDGGNGTLGGGRLDKSAFLSCCCCLGVTLDRATVEYDGVAVLWEVLCLASLTFDGDLATPAGEDLLFFELLLVFLGPICRIFTGGAGLEAIFMLFWLVHKFDGIRRFVHSCSTGEIRKLGNYWYFWFLCSSCCGWFCVWLC